MRKAIYLTVNDYYYKLGFAQAKHVSKMHKDVDVYLFVEDLNTTHSPFDDRNLKVRCNCLTEWMPKGLKATAKLPVVAYARLFAAFFLSDYDRIIYLDADTLVIKNCNPLFEIEGMQDKAIAAVADQSHKARLKRKSIPSKERLAPKGNFNSGVLLINPEEYIQHDIHQALSNFMEEYYDVVRYADQDFINHYFYGQTLELHPKWNYQAPYITYGLDALGPAILHFSGESFPWQKLNWEGDKIFCKMFATMAESSGYTLKDFPVKRRKNEHHAITKLRDHFRFALQSSGIRNKPPASKVAAFWKDRSEYAPAAGGHLSRWSVCEPCVAWNGHRAIRPRHPSCRNW